MLYNSILQRTHFSDPLYTLEIIKFEFEMRPLFLNKFLFLVLLVSSGSLLSFFFHFLVVLVPPLGVLESPLQDVSARASRRARSITDSYDI